MASQRGRPLLGTSFAFVAKSVARNPKPNLTVCFSCVRFTGCRGRRFGRIPVLNRRS